MVIVEAGLSNPALVTLGALTTLSWQRAIILTKVQTQICFFGDDGLKSERNSIRNRRSVRRFGVAV